MEPFGVGFPFHIVFLQISVKIVVAERVARTVVVNGGSFPPQNPFDVGGFCLLVDTVFNLLFGISDLRPPVVIADLRRGVGITHRNDFLRRLDVQGFCHYAISLTRVSIKAISSSERPYFL